MLAIFYKLFIHSILSGIYLYTIQYEYSYKYDFPFRSLWIKTVASIVIAVTLILGLFSRLGAFLGALMAINLWLGFYRSPAEWPWTYFFLIVVQIMLLVQRSGRSLGLDAILLRHEQESSDRGLWGRLVRLSS